MAITPTTHLEKSIAGQATPTTHLEKVIAEYGGGGGGSSVDVDPEISGSSQNPVENRAIASALGLKADKTEIADFVTESEVTAEIETAIGGITSFEYYLCGAGEYDPNTGIPTVQEADTNHIYLTPTSGTNLNMYAYINSVFTFLGTTEVDLGGYAKTVDLARIAFTGRYSDILNPPTIPTQVIVDQQLTPGGTNPVESHAISAALSLKADIESLADVAFSGDYSDLDNTPTIPAAVTVDSTITSGGTNPVQGGAIHAALAQKANSSTVAQKANTADLANVAFSGSYNDLINKPTIPVVPNNLVTGSASAYTINVSSSAPAAGTLNSIITIVM